MSEPNDAAHQARPLQVALVGYGLAGYAFHAPLIEATPGMRLAAVVTANPERARSAASRHPGARILSTADEVWANSEAYDLVVIATPNRTHVPLAHAALAAGLPVVVDKPLAPSAEEGRGLVAAARERGLLLSVFHNRRWDGDFLTLRRLVDEGALGALHRFESRFERWRPAPRDGWRERADPREAGGVLFDLGSHLIDQALLLLGPVAEVHAELRCLRAGVAVDDDAFLALTHASGVISHLWMSLLAADTSTRFRVLGDRAAYVKEGTDPQEAALRAGEMPDARWGQESPDHWGRVGAEEEWRAVPTEPGNYPAFYAGIVEALRSGSPPPVDAMEAVRGLEIIEAARRSATGEGSVRVPRA